MPLSDFLYRCPSCGAAPTVAEGMAARCPRCSRSYTQGQGGGLILECSPDGSRRAVHAAALAREMIAQGGPEPIPGEGTSSRETRVRFRRVIGEDPIRHEGRLLGYAERFDASEEGVLHLDPLYLRILPADRNGDGEVTWALEDIQAIQASSSSIQVSASAGGVVLLRFLEDSPRRWDDLLRAALQARWDALGRGPIVEFQPRIRGL